MYEIEKDIPLPKAQTGRPQKYPFPSMLVGDSFAVEADADTNVHRLANGVGAAHVQYVKRHQPTWKFSCRIVSPTALRVWRIQ